MSHFRVLKWAVDRIRILDLFIYFFSPQVSICKFKFHKGENPSLEEKKMLSVDGGHFRYYSGGDSCTGLNPQAVETIPREAMTANAGHLVTDRFTSLTAEKLKQSSLSKLGNKMWLNLLSLFV